LENYQKSGLQSSGVQLSDKKRLLPALPVVGAQDIPRRYWSVLLRSEGYLSPLVPTPISQHEKRSKNPVLGFVVYHRAVRLLRVSETFTPVKPPPPRGEIQSFTAKSRARLQFTAGNSPQLKSQFGMTYHKSMPDGRTTKRHLNAFLVAVRRSFPWFQYLWILEFQSRGTAHFHLFSNLESDGDTRATLAHIWHRIAEPTSPEHLTVHLDQRNLIEWDMGSGAYLCKYLSKESQKSVPEYFTGVGRFWGSSVGLVQEKYRVEACDIVDVHGEYAAKNLVRNLCKHNEKRLRKIKMSHKKGARIAKTSHVLPCGSGAFEILLRSTSKASSDIDQSPSSTSDFFFPWGNLPY